MPLILIPFSAHAAFISSVSIETDGTVQFVVKKGQLKPQLVSLIAEHPRNFKIEKIVWEASDAEWPIDAAYRAETIDGLINDVATQANLYVTYHSNGYVVVSDEQVKK